MIERGRDARFNFVTASRSARSIRLSYSKGLAMPVSTVSGPALDLQTGDAAELGLVACNEGRLFMNRMRRDQQIQRTDGPSCGLQPRSDLAVRRSRLSRPVENRDERQESADRVPRPVRLSGLRDASPEFGSDN